MLALALAPAPPLADPARVVKDEEDGAVVAAAAFTPMLADFASPGSAEAPAAAKQLGGARKRRLTEAQRLQPFVWEQSGGDNTVGPALLAQFAGAEVRRAARSAT